MQKKEIKLNLKCTLSESEVSARARNLARLHQDVNGRRSEAKEAATEFKSQITTLETTIQSESNVVNNGYEYREVPCRVEYNIPKRGEKTVYRKDTDTIVRSEPMDSEDEQMAIDFQEPSAAIVEDDAGEDDPWPNQNEA